MKPTRAFALAAAVAITSMVACADDVADVGPAPVLDGPAPPLPARAAARLQVDQLRDSIPVVAGDDATGAPIGWVYQNGPNRADLFAVLGSTMGNPNYISITNEPAVADAMYLKFGADIALNVCYQMGAADAVSGSGPRTLSRFAALDGSASDADLEANIRYLHLRFFGERVAPDDTTTVEQLRAVYDAGVAGATTPIAPAEGWRAVCVAMLQAPAFHIY